MTELNPIKVTAEFTITPEMFYRWCNGDFPVTETYYKHFVESMIDAKFGRYKDYGGYDNFINNTIPDNGNGLKLTVEELK